MIGIQVLADAGEHAAWPATGGFNFFRIAGEAIHIRGRAAQVGDNAGEAWHRVANLLDFLEDRFLGAALDDSPLMLGDGAERTAAKTAPHDVHGKANHLVGGDAGIAVVRMRHALVGHAKDVVHLLGGKGLGRSVQPQLLLAVLLHQRPRVARIGLEMQHAVGVSVHHRIVANVFEGRQTDDGLRAVLAGIGYEAQHVASRRLWLTVLLLCRAGLGVLGVYVGADNRVNAPGFVDSCGVDLPKTLRRVLSKERGAAYVGDLCNRLSARQPVCELDNGALCVAVEQDVCMRVDQDRSSNLVLPVVVMCYASERRFDAAEHDRHVAESLTTALRVYQ